MSKKPVTLEYILKGVKARLDAIPINWNNETVNLEPPPALRRERRVRRQFSEFQAAVNRMSNWDRNQWARAGDKERQVDHFLALKRRA